MCCVEPHSTYIQREAMSPTTLSAAEHRPQQQHGRIRSCFRTGHRMQDIKVFSQVAGAVAAAVVSRLVFGIFPRFVSIILERTNVLKRCVTLARRVSTMQQIRSGPSKCFTSSFLFSLIFFFFFFYPIFPATTQVFLFAISSIFARATQSAPAEWR